MKTNLLLLKSSLLQTSGVLKVAFLLLVLLLTGTATRAQVVYSMGEPGNTSAAISGDLVKKMNYDGTNVSTVITGTNAGLIQPFAVALDGNSDRIFVSEGNLSGNVIKVITGSSVTNTITSANSAYIKDINYDVVGNWLYYITEGGDITQVTANDALYRVHPDGSGTQTLAASVTKNPYRLEVDAANNKVYVVDVSFNGRSIKTVDLANSNAVTSRAFATSLNSVYDVALDKVTGYLYYCAEGGSAATLSATDQVRRQNIDGTNDVQIAASVCNSPFRLGLDAGNNRLYVGDAYYGTGKIVAINLTNNTFSTTLNFTTGQNTPQIYDFGVPDRPTVATAAASSFTATSATLGGTLVYGYGLSTERGVVYSSTNATPTVSDTKVSMVTNTTNAAYSASVSSLSPSTTYYARAYAINGAGTTYGAVVTFATLSNDATLSGFTLSSGTLTPTFTVATTTYTASVTNSTTAITVTPTRNQANATIKVNNTTVASGSASGSIGLAIGNNIITTIVTAQDGSTKTYTLTVNRPKAAQTITFASTASKTFGNADFAAGASTNSGLTISYTSSNTGVATVSGGTIHIVAAGNTTITASQAGDANYLAATSATQTLTVDKSAQTITFGAIAAKTYGNPDFAPGATVASGLNVTYASDNTAVATIVNNQVHIVGQGTGNITASQGGNANYNAAANVVQSLTVNKATVIVTAAAKTKVYGDSDPAFTFAATGVVGSDAPTGALSRVTTGNNRFVGTYAIDQGTLSYGNNYNVTYLAANLTIARRPITLLPVGKTKVYGDYDPYYNQFQVTVGSIAPGDATGDQFGRAAGEDVGTYLMTFGTKKFYGDINGVIGDITSNYNVTIQPAYAIITAKPVTVTADVKSKTFGDPEPALTYTNTELAYNESFTGALTRAAGEAAGVYAINKGTLALSSNYNISYTGASLTIDKKLVNVNVIAQSKTFGDTDPALTYTADALASGDSFSGALSRATGENFGTYAISQGTLAVSNGSNYTLNFTGSNLTINKKTINVTAAAKAKIYGDSDPALTYTADALAGSDSFTGNITRAAGETFGNYAINQGTLALSSNYTLNYTGANFSIGKRSININAIARDKQYGDPDGLIGYSFSGTPVTGDTFSGALGREPGTSVGTYAITIGNFAISNGASYDLILRSAPFNILQREVVVAGVSTIKIYGDADPALLYNVVSGSLVDGAQITGSLTRNAGETAGPYAMAIGTLSINNPNHKLTFQGGYFEVDRAPLTIHIDNKTKVATKANPPLTYSVTGLRNGDTEAAAFTEAVRIATDVNATTAAGEYPIYLSSNTFAINYNISSPNGVFTVTPASTINTLASATVPNGVFDVPFDAATDYYQVTVPNGTTATSLTVTVTDPTASITVGYDPSTATAVASGTPYNITLSPGYGEQVPVNVTAQDGSVKNYYFNINPVPSDSKLSNLVTSIGTISPAFSANVNSYSLDVSAETASITITPTTHDPLATARVSGGEGGGNGPKTISLHEGLNFTTVTVRSADRTSTTTYQLAIKRPIRLTGLTLSAGTLYPAFNPNTDTYAARVNAGIASVTVSPTAAESYFQLYVNGENVYTGTSQPITINDGVPTVITTKVVAGDGETSKTYTINVERSSTEAGLASLAINHGTLSPVFSSAVTTYSATVANNIASISLTPTVVQEHANIKINGVTVAGGAASGEIALALGNNTITTVVTAEDGTTVKTYTLTVTRSLSDNANLAGLVATGLTQTFNAAVTTYSATVANSVSSITLTPTTADATATIKVNGQALVSGTASQSIPLVTGANTINTVVTAQDGTTTKTYVLTITRQASSNAYVSALQVIGGSSQTQVSGPSDENYRYKIAQGLNSVKVKPTAKEPNAVIRVNGVVVASGTESQSIAVTDNSIINVVVTAQDGTTTRSYGISFIRGASSVAYLSAIQVNPGSSQTQVSGPSDENYRYKIAQGVNSVKVKPTAQEPNAVIRVNGVVVASGTESQSIAVTDNSIINVMVTAQDGTITRSYGISFIRGASSVAYLSAIQVNPGSSLTQVSGPSDENYRYKIAQGVNSVKVKPTAQEPNAVIRVNGLVVASDTESQSIAITDNSIINVVVTAQDGTTTRSYGISFIRGASSVAYLSAVQVNPGSSLTQVSGPSDENYRFKVGASINSVKVKPTAQEPNAVIRVNGVVVTSGTESQPISITDNTIINVLVTAQDGITTRSYGISFIRGASSNAFLSNLPVSPATYTGQVSGASDENYSFDVSSGTGNVTVKPTAQESHAVIRVDGVVVASGADSQPVTITGNTTNIVVLVTAEDGVTTHSYGLVIHRALPPAIMSIADKNKVQKLNPNTERPTSTITELVVHQGLSPNGDGINDYFTIEGIRQYPVNKLSVMNAGGALVYETQAYGINGNVFDGHGNKGTTQMQKAGTYYYSLEYKTEEGNTKRKTGYLIIK